MLGEEARRPFPSPRCGQTGLGSIVYFQFMVQTVIECDIVHIFESLEAFTLSFASRNIRYFCWIADFVDVIIQWSQCGLHMLHIYLVILLTYFGVAADNKVL